MVGLGVIDAVRVTFSVFCPHSLPKSFVIIKFVPVLAGKISGEDGYPIARTGVLCYVDYVSGSLTQQFSPGRASTRPR